MQKDQEEKNHALNFVESHVEDNSGLGKPNVKPLCAPDAPLVSIAVIFFTAKVRVVRGTQGLKVDDG